MENKYGLQLYSVRDITQENLAGAIEKVAGMGYSYLEFAGFFGHTAEEVCEMMKNNGVTCSGTHSSWLDLRPSVISETLKFHTKIGNPNYIVPGADLSTLDKIHEFVSVMNFAQPILAAEGIRLGYHNHSNEFQVQPWGSTIHSELERLTGMEFEIDTYWAFNAGIDPLAVLDRLKDRISVIHLKDGFAGGKGVVLGAGEAPVAAVHAKAKELGFTIVVESETLSPDGLTEARLCMEYLKTLQ